MLKSYEAIYEKESLHWLREKPSQSHVRVIVTILEEPVEQESYSLEEIQTILSSTRGIFDPQKSMDEIDQELEQKRQSDWQRE